MTTLNQFADVKADLPKGWEKKLNKEGKVGYNDNIIFKYDSGNSAIDTILLWHYTCAG